MGSSKNQYPICDNKTKSISEQRILAVSNLPLISGKRIVNFTSLLSLAACLPDSEEVLREEARTKATTHSF